ncbi:hypothetical protein NKH60_18605 [Mesorhizobium sp. M1006]|uniref:hypothetical protein n=1 Tax=Mesorhizobium sp. M1006 TaxID=2957048 RepID=UPI00333A2EA9
MAEMDPAYVLFPGDAPSKPAQAPDWYQAQRSAAEQRLTGTHDKPDAAAAVVFTSERKAEAPPPAGKDDDAAAILFRNDALKPDAAISEALAGRMEGYELDARLSGEGERADELASAMSSLTADFSKHGTSEHDVKDMMELLHDGKARFAPPTETEAGEAYSRGMEVLASEYADEAAMQTDLAIARRFVADLSTVSPGVIETLEASGMGSDPRMIRLAIREAKRRNYR